MKKILLFIVLPGVCIGLIALAVLGFGSRKNEAAPAVVAAPVMPPNPSTTSSLPPAPKPPALMPASDWRKYRSARLAALETNPALRSEYTQILKDLDAQQARLDEAMVKAKPEVAPIKAKLVILRQRNGGPIFPAPATGTGHPAPAGPPVVLTQEDLQVLRGARAEALQAHPELRAKAQKLADEMRVFEAKLDALMLKADPSVSPAIAKFEGGRNPQVGTTTNPTQAK